MSEYKNCFGTGRINTSTHVEGSGLSYPCPDCNHTVDTNDMIKPDAEKVFNPDYINDPKLIMAMAKEYQEVIDKQAKEIERLKLDNKLATYAGEQYAKELFKTLAPQCEPLTGICGLLSQIDNWCAGASQQIADLKANRKITISQMDSNCKALGAYALESLASGVGIVQIDFNGISAEKDASDVDKNEIIFGTILHELHHALRDFLGLELTNPDGMCGGEEQQEMVVVPLDEHEKIVADLKTKCEQQAGVIISQEKQIQMMFTWHSNNCKDIKTLCADLDKKTNTIEQQAKEVEDRIKKEQNMDYTIHKQNENIADLAAENKRLSAMIDVLTKGKP
jgi:hypothetical protein